MADETKTTSDPAFEKNPLPSLIENDISSRSKWEEIDKAILKARLVERKAKRMKPYPGAPNFVVPIIDDVTRDKVTQEMNMILGAQRFAYLIALAPEADATVIGKAEVAFDTYLRHVIKAAPKLEEADDSKVARGFAVLKVIRTMDERWGEVPDFDTFDIRDIVVPSGTKDIQKAERITQIFRWSPHVLRTIGERRGWDKTKVEKIIELYQSENREKGSKTDDTLEITRDLIGISTGGKGSETVTIWECWHNATDWDVKQGPGVVKGKKCCTVFSPAEPETTLACFPWREDDSLVKLTPEEGEIEIPKALQEKRDPVIYKKQQGKERKWPYIQARAENRSRYYYDTRGSGRLCMDDQLAATALQNAKMVMQDYFQLPLFKGTGSRTSTNVSYEPGSFLPADMDPVVMPQIPAQFDFDIDSHKKTAGRRIGAGGGDQYSGEVSTRRKIEKTATEIQDQAMRSDVISSADVDRFNGPFGELFQQ